MAFPTAGPSRPYNLHQDLPPQPPILPSKTPSPYHSPSYSPNPDSGWNTMNGNGHTQLREPGGQDDRAALEASKRNPLVDLMDSEKTYVDQLALVIRRVAAAWSRKDFPPPKLDAMFRCVEAVYRANRSFGNRLRDIGPNPSSPKALGDLLMRWIDDLEPAYAKYSSSFLTGFDSWPRVTQNPLLPAILSEISVSNPPTPPLAQWTLDALFLLPFTRLRYYRKLYARLLRSTKEGRSDHRLLVVANQKLESLVSQVESRLEMDVADEEQGSLNGDGASRDQTYAERERQSRTSSGMNSSQDSEGYSPFSSRVEDPRLSGGSAATSVTTQSPQRRPQIVVPAMTPANQPSPPSPASVADLEMRIDPERTLDLFTMTPKKCKLQMNPPQLPFQRNLRSSHDVTIYFTPNSTGQQVVHQRAHVFVLTDLFLVAEWMEAMDKATKAQQVAREQPERVGKGGPMPEMWLSYPPLAGKHLMVAEGAQANVLNLMIMKKETFAIHLENEMARDQLMKDLLDCIEYAATGPRNAGAPIPSPVGDARSPSSMSDARSGESHMPTLRYPSPFSPASSPSVSPRVSDPQEGFPPPIQQPPGNLVSQMNTLNLQPGQTMPVDWSRGSTPDPALAAPPRPAMPMPGPPPAMPGPAPTTGSLPPRNASLRPRVPSGPPGPPPHPSAYNHYSDPVLPGHGQGSSMPRSASGRSVSSQPRPTLDTMLPPVPTIRGPGSAMSDSSSGSFHAPPSRSRSAEPLRPPDPPSARFSSFPSLNTNVPSGTDADSPPASPEEEEVSALTGPATISAQMKCKVFLKQAHQQWKSLGAAKLKLYVQQGQSNTKQLVVESDSSSKAMLISTIVLTDGVERVAKTGVAVEISDRGKRTGIIYMIQLRNENSAMGLFESLLAGSDRAVR